MYITLVYVSDDHATAEKITGPLIGREGITPILGSAFLLLRWQQQ
jgi:hypothetical protein